MRDKEKAKAYAKEYYQKNKEKIDARAKMRETKPRDKEKRKAYDKEYYQKNKEKIKAHVKMRYNEDPEKARARNKARYERNKESILANSAAYSAERYRVDPYFRLTINLRSRLGTAIRDGYGIKCGNTLELTGCTWAELRSHLESQFTEGMTWENYGKWHVDHIRPCASFDLSLDEEQKICFNYSNLQPLWAKDNLRKSDKYEEQKK